MLLLGLATGLWACAGALPPPETDPLLEYGVYLEALKAGDVEVALARSWQPRDARSREAGEARLVEAARLLRAGTLRIDAVEARSEGRWALVVLRLTQQAPRGEVSLLREELLLGVDGRWLVVARSLRGNEQLRSAREASHDALLDWFRESEPDLSERWLHER